MAPRASVSGTAMALRMWLMSLLSALQALPAGSHLVEWAFRPLTVFVGLGWAGITLLGVAVTLALRRLSRIGRPTRNLTAR